MMNSYELMGSKSSPLCHMFDSDRLLASDSNEDSDDHSGGASSADKYHTLDHLDSYDTITDLENHLMNGHSAALGSGHQSHGLSADTHLQSQQQNSLNLNQHLMSSSQNSQNCLQNSQQKRKNGTDSAQNGITAKRVPPANGKKTKGRVKIKMEFIDNKLRRYTTFSKRKTGIMKKAYELSTLTGTQVMLLVASETGHVYTFATRKLQPMITSDAGKALIQTCLNSPDPNGLMSGDQRMSATGFEETDLTYAVGDESPNDKSDESCDQPSGQCHSSAESSEEGTDSPELLSSVMLGAGHSSAATYAQLENALPLNYLTEANLISNKLATNRQLLSQLTNANVLSTSSLSHTSTPSSSPSLVNSVSGQSSPVPNSKTTSKQLGTKSTIQAMPQLSHTSAQQLLSAGNILLCTNGGQLTLPSGQTTQSSTTSQTLMYNPTQGVVYATAGAASANGLLADGLILNLGQNQSTGAEFLLNNNVFSQLQLKSGLNTAVNTSAGLPTLKRPSDTQNNKKQRTKQ